MSNLSSYESKAQISAIRATSRASVKVHDNYYTVEYTEERTLPTDIEFDIEKERAILWDTVNTEVDAQIEDIIKSFAKK
jgi:hypothetical protein